MNLDTSALFTLSYGLYTIGSFSGDRINAQIANAVFQITSKPARIAVAINRQELTNEFIKDSGYLSIGVLSQTADMPFIGHFGFKSGRDIDKFSTREHLLTPSGCPCPKEHILSWMELQVESEVEVDTHTLFIGRLVNCMVTGEGIPMTYNYYQEVLRGRTPPTAPSFKAPQTVCDTQDISKEEETRMKKYVCNVCGYVYDPEVGDPDGGIAPGTAFEDIPDDWVCPVCGVGKDQFTEE